MGFFANQKRFASIKNTFAGLVRYIILRLQHFLRVRRHFLILVSRRRDLTCTLSCLDAKRRLLTPVSHSQVAPPIPRNKVEYLSKSQTNDEDDCGITTPKGQKRRGTVFAAQNSCLKLLWEVTSSEFEWERKRILHHEYF